MCSSDLIETPAVVPPKLTGPVEFIVIFISSVRSEDNSYIYPVVPGVVCSIQLSLFVGVLCLHIRNIAAVVLTSFFSLTLILLLLLL